jgi:uncharacterized protein (DUF2235 family)
MDPKDSSLQAPKTIVLLADGTGNSAAKIFKTNVWRLYKSLDLSDPPAPGETRQIAYYHDGVGTSTFKPLALLGGAFGIGLKRNIIQLYLFLCRNYAPGDRIYVYGFSRGAFTARVLASLIITQGILSCRTEVDLRRYASDAYRRYRRRYKLPLFGRKDKTAELEEPEKIKVGLVDRLRDLRDAVIWLYRRATGHTQYEVVREANRKTTIAFVGVWDTVAAYGLPVDEMTRGIDEWVWPLSMPNYSLSPKVLKARHALSLDDERDTFHPQLWDEIAERRMIESGKVQKDRLRQVWFAGMHSNVGGGYADDALSYGALHWMIDESRATGLRFLAEDDSEALPTPQNDFGLMYNSRSGVGAYYRYQPRKIAARLEHPDPNTLMMQDPNRRGVGFLTTVTIHESVWHRIAAGTDSYAPIVIPDRFHVLKSDGTTEERTLPLAEPSAGQSAVSRSEWVWNDVWRRRVNYFLTVGASIVLAALPLLHAIWPPSACVGPQCVLGPVIEAAGGLLPSLVQPWIRAFSVSPGVSVVLALVIVGLMSRSAYLKRSISDGMRELWEISLGRLTETDAVTAAGTYRSGPRGGIYGLRSNRAYQGAFQWLKWRVFPGLFGFSVLVGGTLVAAIVAIVAAQRIDIAWSEWQNRHCQFEAAPASPYVFRTSERCSVTRMAVQKGERYLISFEVTQPWVDRTIPTSPTGFESSRMTWYARSAVLLRRALGGRWFQPMLKIVPESRRGGHIQLLDLRCDCGRGPVYSTEFTATRSGDVVLFVNDVMPTVFSGLFGKASELANLYANNRGEAKVTITPIPTEPPK